MTLVRSIVYGYLGAILGGLVVAVITMPLDASLETVVGAASVTGVVLGLLGLMLPWRQAAVTAAGREAESPPVAVSQNPDKLVLPEREREQIPTREKPRR